MPKGHLVLPQLMPKQYTAQLASERIIKVAWLALSRSCQGKGIITGQLTPMIMEHLWHWPRFTSEYIKENQQTNLRKQKGRVSKQAPVAKSLLWQYKFHIQPALNATAPQLALERVTQVAWLALSRKLSSRPGKGIITGHMTRRPYHEKI